LSAAFYKTIKFSGDQEMTDNKNSCAKDFSDSGIKFPCGNLEKMLKAFRQCGDGKGGKVDCSEIIKKFSLDALINILA